MELITSEEQYLEVISRITGLELSAERWLLDHPGDHKRMSSFFERACEVFGFPEAALMWLTQPQAALGGLKPSRLIVTSSGTEQCLALLNRIEHELPF